MVVDYSSEKLTVFINISYFNFREELVVNYAF